MGSVKITVELKCAQCGKKLSTKGKAVSGRRYSHIHMPDVWETDWIKNADFHQSSINITKGYNYHDGDDDDIYCSRECVLEFVAKILPKLKTEKEDED